MSNDINRVIITGRLGADPELRMTQSGTPVLSLRIASSREWFDKATNAKKEDTAWVNASCFGKRADALAKILHKGDRVMIEGSLRTSQYEKDGVKHNRVEIAIDEIVFGGGSRRDDSAQASGVPGASGERRQQHGTNRGGGGGSARGAAPAPAAQADDWGGAGDADDGDIPF